MTAIAEPIAAEPGAAAPLPYGPLMTRLLRPLQRGFLVLNGGFMAPLLRSGFGWLIANPFTGHLMLLRTRGRRTGLVREAPLGYVIRSGCVYVVAGYGEPTPWFRNLLAEPGVEVILPTRRFHGRAEPVSDPVEWVTAYRALIASFGLIGNAIVGDVHGLDDEALLARDHALPVIRFTPTDGSGPVVAGAFDPGGMGWLLPWGASIILVVLVWVRFGLRRQRRGRGQDATPR